MWVRDGLGAEAANEQSRHTIVAFHSLACLGHLRLLEGLRKLGLGLRFGKKCAIAVNSARRIVPPVLLEVVLGLCVLVGGGRRSGLGVSSRT